MGDPSGTFEHIGLSEKDLLALINGALTAKKRAYCVYSHFPVGAALLTEEGNEIFIGCNVENSSFGLTICAERAAITSAVAAGYRKFKFIAVTTDLQETFASPCGACRQVIVEFAQDCNIILIQPGHSTEDYLKGKGIKMVNMLELQPYAFTPTDLKIHSQQDVSNGHSTDLP